MGLNVAGAKNGQCLASEIFSTTFKTKFIYYYFITLLNDPFLLPTSVICTHSCCVYDIDVVCIFTLQLLSVYTQGYPAKNLFLAYYFKASQTFVVQG